MIWISSIYSYWNNYELNREVFTDLEELSSEGSRVEPQSDFKHEEHDAGRLHHEQNASFTAHVRFDQWPEDGGKSRVLLHVIAQIRKLTDERIQIVLIFEEGQVVGQFAVGSVEDNVQLIKIKSNQNHFIDTSK